MLTGVRPSSHDLQTRDIRGSYSYLLVPSLRPCFNVVQDEPGLVDEDAAPVPGHPQRRVSRHQRGQLLRKLVRPERDVGHVVEYEVLGAAAPVGAERVVRRSEDGRLAVEVGPVEAVHLKDLRELKYRCGKLSVGGPGKTGAIKRLIRPGVQ